MNGGKKIDTSGMFISVILLIVFVVYIQVPGIYATVAALTVNAILCLAIDKLQMIEVASNYEAENAANKKQEKKLNEKGEEMPIIFFYKSTTGKLILRVPRHDLNKTKRHVGKRMKQVLLKRLKSIETLFKKLVFKRRHGTTPTKTTTHVSDCTWMTCVEKQNSITGKIWNNKIGAQKEGTDCCGNEFEEDVDMKITIRDDNRFTTTQTTEHYNKQLAPVSKISIDGGKERIANHHAAPLGTMRSLCEMNNDISDCNNNGVEKPTVVMDLSNWIQKEEAQQDVTVDDNQINKPKYDNSGSETNSQTNESASENERYHEVEKDFVQNCCSSLSFPPDLIGECETLSLFYSETSGKENLNLREEWKEMAYHVFEKIFICPHGKMVKTSDTTQTDWITELYVYVTRSSVYKFSFLFFVQFRITDMIKKNVLFVNSFIMTKEILPNGNRNNLPKNSTVSLTFHPNDDPNPCQGIPSQSRLQKGIVKTSLQFASERNVMEKPLVLQAMGKKVDNDVVMKYGGNYTPKNYGRQNGMDPSCEKLKKNSINENTLEKTPKRGKLCTVSETKDKTCGMARLMENEGIFNSIAAINRQVLASKPTCAELDPAPNIYQRVGSKFNRSDDRFPACNIGPFGELRRPFAKLWHWQMDFHHISRTRQFKVKSWRISKIIKIKPPECQVELTTAQTIQGREEEGAPTKNKAEPFLCTQANLNALNNEICVLCGYRSGEHVCFRSRCGGGRAFGDANQSNDEQRGHMPLPNMIRFQTANVSQPTHPNIPSSDQDFLDHPSEQLLFSQSIISSPESDMNDESTQGGVIVENQWDIDPTGIQ